MRFGPSGIDPVCEVLAEVRLQGEHDRRAAELEDVYRLLLLHDRDYR